MELPGASAPALAIAVLPTMPVPPRMPPAFTVTPLDEAIEPLTASVPPSTIVAPV
ncbi:hypothetical protein ES707_09339 [subsurface metagenome]